MRILYGIPYFCEEITTYLTQQFVHLPAEVTKITCRVNKNEEIEQQQLITTTQITTLYTDLYIADIHKKIPSEVLSPQECCLWLSSFEDDPDLLVFLACGFKTQHH